MLTTLISFELSSGSLRTSKLKERTKGSHPGKSDRPPLYLGALENVRGWNYPRDNSRAHLLSLLSGCQSRGARPPPQCYPSSYPPCPAVVSIWEVPLFPLFQDLPLPHPPTHMHSQYRIHSPFCCLLDAFLFWYRNLILPLTCTTSLVRLCFAVQCRLDAGTLSTLQALSLPMLHQLPARDGIICNRGSQHEQHIFEISPCRVVLERAAFGRRLGHKAGALSDGIRCPYKRDPRALRHVRT